MSDYQVETSTEEVEFLVIYTGEPVAGTWGSLYDNGTEITVPGYQRALIDWNGDVGNARFSPEVESAAITAVGITDAATGGNLIFYRDIPPIQFEEDL